MLKYILRKNLMNKIRALFWKCQKSYVIRTFLQHCFWTEASNKLIWICSKKISQKYVCGHFYDTEKLSYNRKTDWMTSHIFYDIEVIMLCNNLLSTCASFCWCNLKTKFKHRLPFRGKAKVNRGTGILYTICSCQGHGFIQFSVATNHSY